MSKKHMEDNKMVKSNQPLEAAELYQGIRGKDFRDLLAGVLKKGKMIPQYINLILDEEGMDTFEEAFTAASFNPNRNYEMLEQLGDVLANAAIKWYMTRRFPVIRCPEGVGIGSLLLINYGAKQSFYGIAENLGFWPYISASVDQRKRGMKPLLEDVFEAFIGAVAETIDKRTCNGVGFGIIYGIIESVFDDMDISLAEEDLKDAKTWLKECLDRDRSHGEATYLTEKEEIKNNSNPGQPMYINISTVYQLRPEKKAAKYAYDTIYHKAEKAMTDARKSMEEESTELASVISEQKRSQKAALLEYKKHLIWLGEGKAALKKDAEKKAAKQGVETLKRRGIVKKVNETFDGAAGQRKDDRKRVGRDEGNRGKGNRGKGKGKGKSKR